MVTCPVDSDGIGRFKDGQKMNDISNFGVLDAKVVNAEDEPDGSVDVCPQAWCVG